MKTWLLVPAGLTMFLPAVADAQMRDERYWLELSLYRPDVDTDMRVSSRTENTVGTDIDLESDLELSNKKYLPSGLLGFRLSDDFVLLAEYYTLNRSGTATLQRDITFDDVTYDVGARLSSSLDSDIYRLSIGWVLVNNPDFAAGAALGFHITDFDARLSGEVTANGQGAATEVRRRNVLAPLPTLGLFADWRIAPRFTLGGRADYFTLKIDDYDGRLLNIKASLLYLFSERFGLGVAWRYVDYRLDIVKPQWDGRVSYAFNGPEIFLHAGF